MVSLVVADKTTGEFKQFGSTNQWRTAGFVTATTIVKSETETSFSYTISASETDLTADLGANEEWRVYIKLGEGDVELKNSDAPVIEIIPSTEILNKITITDASWTSIEPGANILVDFEFTSDADAIVELSIQEWEDAFTPKLIENDGVPGLTSSDSVPTVSEVLYVGDFLASTSATDKKVSNGRFEVLAGTVLSEDLASGQYRIVAKLLHGNLAGGGTFATQTSEEIVIGDPVGLGDKFSAASFTLFPNPSNGVVNFSKEVSNVVVYDATGNIVITEASATSLNTTSLEAGIYMINSNQGSTKFIVE